MFHYMDIASKVQNDANLVLSLTEITFIKMNFVRFKRKQRIVTAMEA